MVNNSPISIGAKKSTVSTLAVTQYVAECLEAQAKAIWSKSGYL